MAINADSVTPDPVQVTADILPDLIKPRDATPETPPSVAGLSIKESLPPTTKAGVFLAQFVLWITAGSIASFIAYLLFMDLTVAGDVNAAYKQVYSVGAIGAEVHTYDAVAATMGDLERAKLDPNFQMSSDDLRNGQDVAAAAGQLPSVPAADKSLLSSCLPPPTTPERADTMKRCLDLLDRLKSGIIAEASSAAHAQSAADAVGKIGEQRQALHTFWIQAAQLVLLNLLLPLLTALFGYIFGTQQGQRPAP